MLLLLGNTNSVVSFLWLLVDEDMDEEDFLKSDSLFFGVDFCWWWLRLWLSSSSSSLSIRSEPVLLGRGGVVDIGVGVNGFVAWELLLFF